VDDEGRPLVSHAYARFEARVLASKPGDLGDELG
jgi:hypothetical protein